MERPSFEDLAVPATSRTVSVSSLPAVERAREELRAIKQRARIRERVLCPPARAAWKDIEQKLTQWEERLGREETEAIGPALAQLSEILRAAEAFLDDPALEEAPLESAVTRVMSPLLRICRPDDPLGAATQIMSDQDCSAVPVVDGDSTLIGVITDRDACLACHVHGVSPDELTAGAAMSTGVATCRLDTSIERALELMAERGLRRLVIVGLEGEPIGMVTLGDIARFVQCLAPEALVRGSYLEGRALAGGKPVTSGVLSASGGPLRAWTGFA